VVESQAEQKKRVHQPLVTIEPLRPRPTKAPEATARHALCVPCAPTKASRPTSDCGRERGCLPMILRKYGRGAALNVVDPRKFRLQREDRQLRFVPPTVSASLRKEKEQGDHFRRKRARRNSGFLAGSADFECGGKLRPTSPSTKAEITFADGLCEAVETARPGRLSAVHFKEGMASGP